MKLSINIPENLKEITLLQYQRWLKVADGQEKTVFLKQKMVEIFCNISLQKASEIKLNDLDRITNLIDKIFESETPLIRKFKLNGIQYGFIPKLDDITGGEFIDLTSNMPDWQKMDKAMNVLFRPIELEKKEKYLIEDYETASKYDLKLMKLDVVFGALVFFWNLKKESTNHILSYLVSQTDVEVPQELRDLLLNTDGINPSTDLQKGILDGLMI